MSKSRKKKKGSKRGSSVVRLSPRKLAPALPEVSAGLPTRPQAVLTVGLSGLAVMADVAGVIGGSPTMQLVVGSILTLAGIATLLFQARLGWVQTPRLTASILVCVGVLTIGIGWWGQDLEGRNDRRAALAETCHQAQDYLETYFARVSKIATSGNAWQTSETESSELERELGELSAAANRSGSEKARTLVQEIRIRTSAAMGLGDRALAQRSMLSSAWKSFRELVSLCGEVGIGVNHDLDPVVEPTIASACSYLAKLIELVKAGKQPPKEEIASTMGKFMYHGMNVQDENFKNAALKFISSMQDERGSEEGMLALYLDCSARGFPMPSPSPSAPMSLKTPR